ncbi:MAG TPA: hypothetical protein VN816_06250 [Acidimicrobiales bacterium]|nr:hypothetical protein [Acidimicrobiales bacterium]
MTNSDALSTDVHPARGRRRRVRPFLKAVLATVVGVLGVGFFASPAFAHANTVTGAASCGSGTFSIKWTIANDYPEHEVASVQSVTGGLGTLSKASVGIHKTPTGTPPSGYSTGTLTQTLPATDGGDTITIDVLGSWSSGYKTPPGTPAVGSVTLPEDSCSISVTKTANQTTVVAGSPTPVLYTLTVTNNSSLPTGGTGSITVTDPVPAGTTYVAGSATCATGTNGSNEPHCSASESSGTVTFTLGTGLAADESAQLTFQVTVDAGDPSGTIPNTATFTGPGCKTKAPGCSTNTVIITVTNDVSVSVVKSADTGEVTAGQATPVTYTLLVSNPQSSTSDTASGVTVADVVPSGLTYVSASCGALTANGSPGSPSCTFLYDSSSQTITFSLGTGIAPGASYPLTFEATVNAGDTTTIVNSATYTGPGCTPVEGATTCPTNKVPITVASFDVTKADSAGSSAVDPGQVVTYTLSAANTGDGPGSITVLDSAPTGTTLTTPAPACPPNTASTCTVSVNGSSISWVITNLPAGTTYALTFAVVVNSDATGPITNTGLYTEPGCTTAGGCPTNTTDNPVPTPVPPVTKPTVSPPPSTVTSSPKAPVTSPAAGSAITGATSVHTGEPWAGSTPYVVTLLALGLSLLGLGQVRRRKATRAPTA